MDHMDGMSGGLDSGMDNMDTGVQGTVACTTAAPDMNMDGHSGMDTGSSCDSGTASNSSGHSVHLSISSAEIYFEAVLLILTIIIGVIVNIVAIAVIIMTKSMRTGTFLMLGNLCLNGLLLAAICMTVHVTSVIQGEWTMGTAMCSIESYLIALCALVSILTHTEVAVVRYCAAVAPQHVYKKLSSWQATMGWLVAAWIMGGAMIGMGVGMGIVHGKYTHLYSRCTPINMDRLLDVVIAGTVVILMCYAVITFCYLRLFIVIRNKVQSLGQTNTTQNVRFIKVTKTLLALSVVFIICWIPFIITCGIDPHHNMLPIFVHRISHDIAEILSCINPIFYFIRIDEFRSAIKRMLRLKGEASTTDGASNTNNSVANKAPTKNAVNALTEDTHAP